MKQLFSNYLKFFPKRVNFKQNILTVCILYCLTLSASASGPDPEPFRAKNRSGRGEPEFVVRSFADKNGKACDQAAFVLGNKRVSIREEARGLTNRVDEHVAITIFVDNKQTAKLTIAGRYNANGKRNFGYPFELAPKTKPEFKIDKNKETITYLKKYLLPDGTETTFSYVLKSLGSSKIEFKWDLGITQEKLDSLQKDFTVSVWATIFNYRDGKIVVGENEIIQQPKAKLMEKVRQKGRLATNYQHVTCTPSLSSNTIIINSGNPLKEVCIELPEKSTGVARENIQVTHGGESAFFMNLHTSTPKRQATARCIIDLGECALPKANTPPAVGGIDFYKADRLHVPKMPTRNLMPNPSFEQGFRYWCWMFGGAQYTPGEDGKRFIIDKTEAKFGKKSLLMKPSVSLGALSFPLPFQKGKTYTVSCYAKGAKGGETLTFCPISIRAQSQFSHRMRRKKSSKFKLTNEWNRYSYTFTQEAGANAVYLGNSGEIKIDGLQVEEGKTATDFASAPVEGVLTTSDSDNNVKYGKPLDAMFHFVGKEGASGKVTFKLFNFYRETLFKQQYDFNVGDSIKLPFDEKQLGTGMFFLRAKFEVEGLEHYYDFYRFTITKFLKNEHATKTLFANLPTWIGQISRSEDLTRNLMRWGFGAAPKMMPYEKEKLKVLDKYKIDVPSYGLYHSRNYKPITGYSKDDFNFIHYIMNEANEIKPEDEKRIEDIAFNLAHNYPEIDTWYFANESECHSPIVKAGNFDEWAKVQIAFYNGIKRANPKARIMPDNGTSGFNPLRGQKETEGYLKSTQGKAKWDVISTHVYGNVDGTGERGKYDLDEMTQYLINLMEKYGCGDAAIQYDEGFLISALRIPEWHTQSSLYFHGPNPSYDLANQEYLQACFAARAYIICLKFWPRLKHLNIWLMMTFLDMNLTPLSVVKAVNTLGNLLQNPTFIADVRPANGVRGYIFKENNQGLAAVWCAMDKVEEGYVKGPVMRLKYQGEAPELIDLMGNVRPAKESDGIIDIQLTPAPLFLRGKDPQALAKMLKESEILGGDANIALRFMPSKTGAVKMDISNLSGREQQGKVKVADQTFDFNLAGKQMEEKTVVPDGGNDFGKMYTFKQDYSVFMKDCEPLNKSWNMHYFYAKQVNGQPNWETIPAIPFNNRHTQKNGKKSEQFCGKFQVAYDNNNLYLRVTCEKPELILNQKYFNKPGFEKHLYGFDGCLEVYLDTGADGMSNTTKGYDTNDYRYDFSMGNPEGESGPGLVRRFKDVDLQLAGGVDFPSKEEAAKNVKCKFIRTEKGFVYEITFPQFYIEPFALKSGNIAGFGLYLHDKTTRCNLTLATKPGAHCDRRPDLWPIIILK